MAAISAAENSPFLTSSVTVFQLRISASARPGAATPRRSSAATAVAKRRRLSRGGSATQRVTASNPPGASRARYACSASTVYRWLSLSAPSPAALLPKASSSATWIRS